MPIDLFYATTLEPSEAIKYFESNGYKITWDWQKEWDKALQKSQIDAEFIKLDLLQITRNIIKEAQQKQIPFDELLYYVETRLHSKGWTGYKLFPLDEILYQFQTAPKLTKTEFKRILKDSPHHLKTLHRTQLQAEAMAARYEDLSESTDSHPYWQYVAILDSVTRPSHAALAGKVFPFDDPFWNSHFPPNGYNCRCSVRALNNKNIKQRRLKVESGEKHLITREKLYSPNSDVKLKTVGYRDPKTKQIIYTDPGFSFNPGKIQYRPDLNKFDKDIAKLIKKRAI